MMENGSWAEDGSQGKSRIDVPGEGDILVVTGEPSGERHAAGLVRQMKLQFPDWPLRWFGSGGSQMAAAGVDVHFDVSQLAAIGPWEALGNMRQYWRLFRHTLRAARRRRPCLAVLVDFPEFNLILARRLKALGIPICYFIGPQVWAWRPSRLKLIRRYVDLMLVILPFEEQFYRSRGVEAHYVGNPTAMLSRFAAGEPNGGAAQGADIPVVALLPGSRKKEVEQIFPIQLDAAACVAGRLPTRFWVVRAPEIERNQLWNVYDRWRGRGNRALQLEIHDGATQRLLPQVSCAIVKSGTSTLEATILKVPFAMVYRLSPVSWHLARPLMGTDTYCLANLIAGRQIVPEFVQHEATGEKIATYISELLRDQERREEVRRDLAVAAEKLGRRDAYQEGARRVGSFLESKVFFTDGSLQG